MMADTAQRQVPAPCSEHVQRDGGSDLPTLSQIIAVAFSKVNTSQYWDSRVCPEGLQGTLEIQQQHLTFAQTHVEIHHWFTFFL